MLKPPLENVLPTYQEMDIKAESLPCDTALGSEPASPVLHPSEPHTQIKNIPVFEEGLSRSQNMIGLKWYCRYPGAHGC